MSEFDGDIQKDLDEGNTFALALVAQDLRNTMKHVATRNLVAVLRKKEKADAGAS